MLFEQVAQEAYEEDINVTLETIDYALGALDVANQYKSIANSAQLSKEAVRIMHISIENMRDKLGLDSVNIISMEGLADDGVNVIATEGIGTFFKAIWDYIVNAFKRLWTFLGFVSDETSKASTAADVKKSQEVCDKLKELAAGPDGRTSFEIIVTPRVLEPLAHIDKKLTIHNLMANLDLIGKNSKVADELMVAVEKLTKTCTRILGMLKDTPDKADIDKNIADMKQLINGFYESHLSRVSKTDFTDDSISKVPYYETMDESTLRGMEGFGDGEVVVMWLDKDPEHMKSFVQKVAKKINISNVEIEACSYTERSEYSKHYKKTLEDTIAYYDKYMKDAAAIRAEHDKIMDSIKDIFEKQGDERATNVSAQVKDLVSVLLTNTAAVAMIHKEITRTLKIHYALNLRMPEGKASADKEDK